jgi:hypothetical protein
VSIIKKEKKKEIITTQWADRSIGFAAKNGGENNLK